MAENETTDLFQEKAAVYTQEPQICVIIEMIAGLYRSGEIPPAIAIQLLKDLDVDYQAFHSAAPEPEESESWQAQKSIQLLFARSVRIDEAFRIRARAYLGENILWLESFLAATTVSC
ncbi:MAG: hypothetical protein ABSF53_20350 [Terracidiphilus sp.]